MPPVWRRYRCESCDTPGQCYYIEAADLFLCNRCIDKSNQVVAWLTPVDEMPLLTPSFPPLPSATSGPGKTHSPTLRRNNP